MQDFLSQSDEREKETCLLRLLVFHAERERQRGINVNECNQMNCPGTSAVLKPNILSLKTSLVSKLNTYGPEITTEIDRTNLNS